ncbi:hypothetical protein NLX83_16125 [Allokutzneria sp. A3M-2-11 16]|uniref:hypothetical protein n=1 Tax=Allokutzneria sp. A3M-2-11 16 TaxID=2962043 RepID=UPI0020B6D516|nr:hypothetical protein [Allokutzneria sp. A3M-2-11 16]MCP3800794.1 hypothetical protein [Allokutzneria sp. A3M-2-11 16]
MSTRLLWMINIGLVAVVLALLVLDYPLAATFAALASVVFSAYVSTVDRKRRRAEFVAEHTSVDHILETSDLSRFREIRDGAGQIRAVREVRRAYPGMDLAEAVKLVENL